MKLDDDGWLVLEFGHDQRSAPIDVYAAQMELNALARAHADRPAEEYQAALKAWCVGRGVPDALSAKGYCNVRDAVYRRAADLGEAAAAGLQRPGSAGSTAIVEAPAGLRPPTQKP